MKRQWQPGDVARVNGTMAVRADDNMGWFTTSGRLSDPNVAYVYRRCCIDFEDREQVERLYAGMWRGERGEEVPAKDDPIYDQDVRDLQAALREFADPPKVEEPLGLGAVVEDADGFRWLRQGDGRLGSPWYRRNSPGAAQHRCWLELNAVRVLSEGVAVDG